MARGERTVHFKYMRLSYLEARYIFNYKNKSFYLIFDNDTFESGKGVLVKLADVNFIDSDLLMWLSVYFGEDFLSPYPEVDTRYIDIRGSFAFDHAHFRKYLSVIEKMPPCSYPKWKRELFDKAIIYFSYGVRSGVSYMPLTLGFFGMSLECIGNIRHGKRNKHYTLGDKRFAELLNTRLRRYKLNMKTKADAKIFQKLILDDVHVINILRNAYYGHSLLHLKKDRLQLTNALKDWYLRSGYSKGFTNISFLTSRIDNDIARESWGLYKVGLRTSRMFIFMLLRFTKLIPFASHDYQAIGDMREDEVSEHRGVKYWSS